MPDEHPSVVAAMRGSVMTQADLVVTVGRRLDFQLAYGSPAVFGDAKLLRIADCAPELRDNRRGAVEILATVGATLEAILAAAASRVPVTDTDWARGVRAKHLERAAKLLTSMNAAQPGSDGLMHPNKLLAALREKLPHDAVIVADGGDFLSFARVGLPATIYIDPGWLGCIGVGTPFGIAASLALPGRSVVVASGDGAFGFNAMEIDTAARHKAPVLIVEATTAAGRSRCAISRRRMARWLARGCSSPTTRDGARRRPACRAR